MPAPAKRLPGYTARVYTSLNAVNHADYPLCSACSFKEVCDSYKRNPNRKECLPYNRLAKKGVGQLLAWMNVLPDPIVIPLARDYMRWRFLHDMTWRLMNRKHGWVSEGENGMTFKSMLGSLKAAERHMADMQKQIRLHGRPADEEDENHFVKQIELKVRDSNDVEIA